MEQNFANKKIKRVDRWIAYVVNHVWVKTGIFIVAFFEATVLPILPEVVVGAVLTYRKDLSWKKLSVVSALGSVSGAMILYLSGRYLYESNRVWFDTFLNGSLVASQATTFLNDNYFIGIVVAAFTPLPDRIFAFMSGVLMLSFPVVIVAFFLGRLLRVGIVAYFSYHYGDEAREYILKHTNKVLVVMGVFIVFYSVFKFLGIF